MTTERLSLLFRVDAAANVAIGLAALGLLAAPDVLGLPRVALLAIGALALGNAIDLARTGRRPAPAPRAVRRSAATDLGFGVALLAVAAVGLPGQSEVARWLLAVVGDVSVVIGGVKLLGVRRLRSHPIGTAVS